MVTERDQRRVDAVERRRGQGAEGEAVDENRIALLQEARDGREARLDIGLARIGKASRQRAMNRFDACLAERCEQPAVVFIAAALSSSAPGTAKISRVMRRRSPRTRRGPDAILCSVTRMREMLSPPGPSAPARAAAAIASKM